MDFSAVRPASGSEEDVDGEDMGIEESEI